jgi:hypothetical protein
MPGEADESFYGGLMRLIPWWTLVSSGCAPVLLVGGWTIAELLQGPDYDPVTKTISVLGAYGAAGYWVITGSVIALGACHLATAYGLRVAATAGRLALAAGGLCAVPGAPQRGLTGSRLGGGDRLLTAGHMAGSECQARQ